MGCDIHMFLERKRSTDDVWHLDPGHKVITEYAGTEDEYIHTSELCSGRSYELFGHLAGVRYMENIVSPLGILKDASAGFITASKQWGSDGHSHSHISISKYKKILSNIGWRINESKMESRDPFNASWNVKRPFHVVLAYIYDQKQLNKVNYILTQDPYYLRERFRLVFFFDN